jgi:hypothetical protein
VENETLAENVVMITPEQPTQLSELTIVATPVKRKYTKRAKVLTKTGVRSKVGSAKAQTQIPKDVSKFIDQLAKDRNKLLRQKERPKGEKVPKVKRAELLREAIVRGAKAMGYKALV